MIRPISFCLTGNRESVFGAAGIEPLMTDEQKAAIEQLRDRKAAKRESAANKLSRKPCKEAGPALFDAFKQELEDDRTWKAKSAQAWALACNPHPPALKFLLGIAGDDLGGSAVNDSVGSAAMAAGMEDPGPDEVLRALSGEEDEVPTDRLAAVVGALRILAGEEVELDDDVAERLVEFAEEDPPNTVPHGAHRRLRVGQLRECLREMADSLGAEHRKRLDAAPE